VTDKNGLT